LDPASTTKIDFVFFDAGGGHRSAANALRSVIEQQGRPWEIRLVNLQEVLDPTDLVLKVTGMRMQDGYNLMLKKGWTLGSPQLVVVMHWLIRMIHSKQVRLLADFWRQSPPDLLVSLIPNFNRPVFQGLKTVRPATPMVTVLTDVADYPPDFWIVPQDQFYVCGSPKAAQQARELGIPADRVFLTSGMILNPKFYVPIVADRAQERQRLGLYPDKPTGLVLFGGQGSTVMRTIVERIERSSHDIQLILICGKNEKLYHDLKGRQSRLPLFVEGFTSEIPYYMHLSDFFIGKPGPGSISEALAMKLPVIVERNAWTLPQERYNTDWVKELDAGVVVPNFRQINSALAELLEPVRFKRFRGNLAKADNRAVFEIPDLIERILQWTKSH
jgi:Glycosyltransferase family 28 C-terminal domain